MPNGQLGMSTKLASGIILNTVEESVGSLKGGVRTSELG